MVTVLQPGPPCCHSLSSSFLCVQDSGACRSSSLLTTWFVRSLCPVCQKLGPKVPRGAVSGVVPKDTCWKWLWEEPSYINVLGAVPEPSKDGCKTASSQLLTGEWDSQAHRQCRCRAVSVTQVEHSVPEATANPLERSEIGASVLRNKGVNKEPAKRADTCTCMYVTLC